jgi:hypothetical protein
LWFTKSSSDWAPVDTTRARAAGLASRPLVDTIAVTWAWMGGLLDRLPLDLDTEAARLRRWHRWRGDLSG